MEKTRKLHEIPVEGPDEKNSGFLMTIEKPQGDDYETSSICHMISSFDKNLRKHDYAFNLRRSQTNDFILTRETLHMINPFCPGIHFF